MPPGSTFLSSPWLSPLAQIPRKPVHTIIQVERHFGSIFHFCFLHSLILKCRVIPAAITGITKIPQITYSIKHPPSSICNSFCMATFYHEKRLCKELQENILIALDIFQKTIQNKPIETELEAWLTFLSCDQPERIIPAFRAISIFQRNISRNL